MEDPREAIPNVCGDGAKQWEVGKVDPNFTISYSLADVAPWDFRGYRGGGFRFGEEVGSLIVIYISFIGSGPVFMTLYVTYRDTISHTISFSSLPPSNLTQENLNSTARRPRPRRRRPIPSQRR